MLAVVVAVIGLVAAATGAVVMRRAERAQRDLLARSLDEAYGPEDGPGAGRLTKASGADRPWQWPRWEDYKAEVRDDA